ncbi:MAG: HAD family hydrolase [Chloroflexi bacterium]|nr:HAD family hydrolase [Chloroflexota bacterium]
MIQAITFDFWDTIVADDSDEPKRAARGLPGKAAARLQLLTGDITRHHSDISAERVAQAFAHTNERFRHFWKNEYITPTVAERLQAAYDFLGIPRTSGFDHIVREIEDMEVHIPPDFAPGVHEALAELAQHYKLGIISDTIHTPGRGLRQLLESQDLLRHFSFLVFSDEVGASKPAPVVFGRAAEGLGAPLPAIVHVGDRESNDVAGPLAAGMRAILYTGVIDRDSTHTQASAICRHYAELPGIIEELDQGKRKPSYKEASH